MDRQETVKNRFGRAPLRGSGTEAMTGRTDGKGGNDAEATTMWTDGKLWVMARGKLRSEGARGKRRQGGRTGIRGN